MKRAYTNKKISDDRMMRIAQACAIVEEYLAQGLSLTLRQLYYQHVARKLCENTQEEYGRLGSIVVDARMCGYMSWLAIEDRTRALQTYKYYEAPQQAVQELADQYRLNKWKDQPMHPEVWVEKEALAGVVEDICGKLQVDFFSCRGYTSKSEMWRAGRRLAGYVGAGQTPIVLHLGDHDPSGIDMTRDIRDQLQVFAGVPIQVVRLALNRNQIDTYNPPPNPAKVTDSRFRDYQKIHGDHSWELDALEPRVLQDLIEGAVVKMRDEARWLESLAQENADREWLRDMSGEDS